MFIAQIVFIRIIECRAAKRRPRAALYGRNPCNYRNLYAHYAGHGGEDGGMAAKGKGEFPCSPAGNFRVTKFGVPR